MYNRQKVSGWALDGDGRKLMEKQLKENSVSLLREYPFDFQRYIEVRLREIDDLEERRFAKEVLLHGLGKAISCMEEKYIQLERRILDEMEIAANHYETVMTIIRREHYDPANGTLYPVSMLDLDRERLAEEYREDNRCYLGTIFLEADDAGQQKFAALGSFSGKLNGQEIQVFAVYSKRYQEAVETLYKVFQDNRIPWQTVHTGYLDKFYDIYLDISPKWLTEGGSGEENRPFRYDLSDVEIDFGIMDAWIQRDVIPLWNIEWIDFDSADFMVPCIDGIYFEHEFLLNDRAEEDGYMIQANEDILEIRHEKKKIVIKSSQEIFERWKALHIIHLPAVRSLDYDAPMLSNHKKESFIRRYAQKQSVPLMTKADLFRRVMELDIGDFIELQDIEVREMGEMNIGQGMLREKRKIYFAEKEINGFACEELFPMESRRTLLLKFQEKQPGHYLNGSMVRFVVSQMQLEINEYRCVGVIL